MKFVTEMTLRALYQAEPFTTYVLEPDTKITPEARQFLTDRGVTLEQSQYIAGKADARRPMPKQKRENWRILRLQGKVEYTEALFLMAGAEMLSSGRNTVLAEQLMVIGKCLGEVRNVQREPAPDKTQDAEWPEELRNCSADLGKDLEISDFHVRLENGREIALLNCLRASLRELKLDIEETYWNGDRQEYSRQDLVDKIDLIINVLCIMLRQCLGGRQWQR